MPKLNVIRYQQDPSCCAVAACATLANFWNINIDYLYSKDLTLKHITKKVGEEGLDSGEICRLLNYLGFSKVTLVTSNLNIIDYSWRHYKRKKVIGFLKESLKKKKGSDYKSGIRSLVKWLSDTNYDNKMIITYDFGKYIRESISKNRPVVLCINWTIFFKYSKMNGLNMDPYNGDTEEHAVVAYGYDSKGVNICDSHHKYYKYSLKKYRKGYYKISWENLMTVMGMGDIYLAEDYRI